MNKRENLDRVFAALADPTRRAIIATLSEGESIVTEIARPFAISLNSVSKHILVLERAEIVVRHRLGREHWLTLNPAPLVALAEWIQNERPKWTL